MPSARQSAARYRARGSEPRWHGFALVLRATRAFEQARPTRHRSNNLTYHPLRDFTPVALISQSPYVLAVYPGLPAKSAKELIALAKSKPGEINSASFQAGSLGHLASALFAYRAGVTLNPVLYRSSAQAVMDAVAGRVEMQFSTLPPAIPLIREGKLRALATTGAKRVSVLSEVPTLAEDGMPGFDVSLWLGMRCRPKAPPAL